ncbi:IS4-like element ISCb2 family transposase [Clostridium beijerinckii]|jgi:Transposase DDE domain.|uniref:IS4-like element ISCb2 family transposase n=3 Tax=Clostridium beijerinckii TaxID=1520 RepID=A0AAE2V0M3_CLOBE|nr:IS4-like element ISCb2 family transposase [Clostridium beijerinckii]ABR36425.1 transposase, IS4 family protein [Clostridium beijerinckii NCIMB 8052]AIU03973.1 transposase, IS4 family protein [Clostridium beijerinckii ATCC 35702]MBF7808928.1 IS4-like element ISCb2 family transposase [Clostridium beijerinckii]NRT22509.1 IS4 transposase [Clostridium beijerinckii]NRT64975.1 IS4 transposase [Clostridium beijerinckii]
MKINLNSLSSMDKIKKIINLFSKRLITKTAVTTGFTQRNSKLDGFTFFKAFTFGVYSLENPSLRNIANFCEDINPNLKVSRQAIENKLKAGSNFLKTILTNIIEDKIIKSIKHNHIEIFKAFNDIKICDSSLIKLNDSLRDSYKGFSEDKSASEMKIQTVYSFKSKQIETFEFEDGTTNDNSYMKTLADKINTNEILLVDLGYFDKKCFKMLEKKSAFFLSKIKYNTALYKENYKKGNFEKVEMIDFLKKSSGVIDTYLYVGMKQNNREEFRVIGKRLPEEIVNLRIRRAREKAKAQGRAPKKIDKELMSWVIMITNIEKEQADVDMLLDIYRLRWQIELLFKCWKSYGKIDHVKSAGIDYLNCLLYGRLIITLLINTVYSELYFKYKTEENREISMLMIYSTIGSKLKEICLNFIPKKENLEIIYEILVSLGRSCKREKRKRQTTEGKLMSYSLPPTIW